MPLFDTYIYHLSPSFPPTRLTELQDALDAHGAKRAPTFQEATLIVTNSHRFEGWEATEGKEDVELVTDKWVERSIVLGKPQPAQFYSPNPALIFSGITAAATALPISDLEVLSAGVSALGGQWRTGLTKDVTHLFALAPDSNKYATAMHFQSTTGVKVILPHWFDDAVRLGLGMLSTAPYEWPDPPMLQGVEGIAGIGKEKAKIADLESDHIKRNMYATAALFTPSMARVGDSSPPPADLEANISLVNNAQAHVPSAANGGTPNVWQGRKIVLSRTLQLYHNRREAVQVGIERAGGIVLRYEGDEEEEEDREIQVEGQVPVVVPKGKKPKKMGSKEKERRRRETERTEECDILITRWRHGRGYVNALTKNKTIGTLAWLFHVQSTGIFSYPHAQLLHYPVPKRPIENFSSHVITVTNYTGEAREYLKKLISAMGATFTPSMSGSNTVLIAAYTSGTKASKALSWSIPVVNHTWLEDCFVQWRNLTLALEKYIVFPNGIDFAAVLGERGIGVGVGVSTTATGTGLGMTVDDWDGVLFSEEEDDEEEEVGKEKAQGGEPPSDGEEEERELALALRPPNGTDASMKEVLGLVEDQDDMNVPTTVGAEMDWSFADEATTTVVEEKEKSRSPLKAKMKAKTKKLVKSFTTPVKKLPEGVLSPLTPLKFTPGLATSPSVSKMKPKPKVAPKAAPNGNAPKAKAGGKEKGNAPASPSSSDEVEEIEDDEVELVAGKEDEEDEEEDQRPVKTVKAKGTKGSMNASAKAVGKAKEKEKKPKAKPPPVPVESSEEDEGEQDEEEAEAEEVDEVLEITSEDEETKAIRAKEKGKAKEKTKPSAKTPPKPKAKVKPKPKPKPSRKDTSPPASSSETESEVEEVEVAKKAAKSTKKTKSKQVPEEGEDDKEAPPKLKASKLVRRVTVELERKPVSVAGKDKAKKRKAVPEEEEEEEEEEMAIPSPKSKMTPKVKAKVATPAKPGKDEEAEPATSSKGRKSLLDREKGDSRTRVKKRKVEVVEVESEDEQEEAEEAMVKGKAKATAKPKAAKGKKLVSESEDEEVVVVSKKSAKGKQTASAKGKKSAKKDVHSSTEEAEEVAVTVQGKKGKTKAAKPRVVESPDDDDESLPAAPVMPSKSRAGPSTSTPHRVVSVLTPSFGLSGSKKKQEEVKRKRKGKGYQLESDTEEDEEPKITVSPNTRAKAKGIIPRTDSIHAISAHQTTTLPSKSKSKSKAQRDDDDDSEAMDVDPATASTSSRAQSEASTTTTDRFGVPRRGAAARATQQLRDKIMPDLVNYEAQVRKSRRSGGGVADFVVDGDGGRSGSTSRKRDEADDEGPKKKKRRVSDEGGDVEMTVDEPKKKGKEKTKATEEEEERPVSTAPKSKKEDISKTSTTSSGTINLLTTQVSLSEDIMKALAKLGAKTTTRAVDCTHLVAANVVRTEKFLCALANAPFILTDKWAIQSAAAKRLLPEKDFLLKDTIGETKYGIKLAVSLQRAKENKGQLLKGHSFYVTPKVQVDKKLLRNVVQAFGGELHLSTPTPRIINSNPTSRHVISCQEDISIWRSIATQGSNVYSQELLLNGALKQEVEWENDAYILRP